MSSSFVIPLSAIFDERGSLLVGWRTDIRLCPDHSYDAFDNPFVKRIVTCFVHEICVKGEWFEIDLVIEKDTDGTDVLKLISFSGFKSTCEYLQHLLGISVEIH